MKKFINLLFLAIETIFLFFSVLANYIFANTACQTKISVDLINCNTYESFIYNNEFLYLIVSSAFILFVFGSVVFLQDKYLFKKVKK